MTERQNLPTQAATQQIPVCLQWEFDESPSGSQIPRWRAFQTEQQRALDDAWFKRESEVLFVAGRHEYLVNLNDMTQVNLSTGTCRPIRAPAGSLREMRVATKRPLRATVKAALAILRGDGAGDGGPPLILRVLAKGAAVNLACEVASAAESEKLAVVVRTMTDLEDEKPVLHLELRSKLKYNRQVQERWSSTMASMQEKQQKGGMPRSMLLRLMVEFRRMEKELGACCPTPAGVLRCTPEADSLLQWDVAMVFPGSKLQDQLEELARRNGEPSQGFLSLQIRFGMNYPNFPPEVWVRKPRLRHGGIPVTHGGRVCSALLASSGWRCGVTMPALLADVQQCLLDAQTEVQDVSGWSAPISCYLPSPPSLDRLMTNAKTGIPTASFVKQSVKAISVRTAAKYWGDAWLRFEQDDRIHLSPDLQIQCLDRHYRSENPGVLILELKTLCGRRRHCAMTQHNLDGIPRGHVVVPEWVMEDLFLESTPDDGRDVRSLLYKLEDEQGRLCARVADMKAPEQNAIAKVEVQCTVEPVSISPQKFCIKAGDTVAVLPGKSLFPDHLHIEYKAEQGWASKKDFEICQEESWPPDLKEEQKKIRVQLKTHALNITQLARAVLGEKCCSVETPLAACMREIVNLLNPESSCLDDVAVAREIRNHKTWRKNFPHLLSQYGCNTDSRPVRLRSVALEPCEYIKLQPHSTEFYDLIKGKNVQSLLQNSLRKTCTALTEDTTILLDLDGTRCPVHITQLKPKGAVRLIEEDLRLVMKPEVEFVPAPDLHDEEAIRSWSDKRVGVEKAKIELARAIEANNRKRLEDAIQRCADLNLPTRLARRCLSKLIDQEKRYEKLRRELQEKAGNHDGSSGEVQIVLQLPDSSTLRPRFSKGNTCLALHALAMNSAWARQACFFAGVDVVVQVRPRVMRTVAVDELIDDLRSCKLFVQKSSLTDDQAIDFEPGETGITCDDDGVVQEIIRESQAHSKGIVEGDRIVKVGSAPFSQDALDRAENGEHNYQITVSDNDTPDEPDFPATQPQLERTPSTWHRLQDNTVEQFHIEVALQDREVQRWINSGVSQEEAIEKVDRGELLPEPLMPAECVMTEEDSVEPVQLERTSSEEDRRVEQVMEITEVCVGGDGRSLVRDILEGQNWNVERAIEALMNMFAS